MKTIDFSFFTTLRDLSVILAFLTRLQLFVFGINVFAFLTRLQLFVFGINVFAFLTRLQLFVFGINVFAFLTRLQVCNYSITFSKCKLRNYRDAMHGYLISKKSYILEKKRTFVYMGPAHAVPYRPRRGPCWSDLL